MPRQPALFAMRKRGETTILSTANEKRRCLRRFRKQASSAPKLEFLLAIYSIHQLQSGRPGIAEFVRDIPETAKTTDRISRYYLHPWYLETLANEILAAPWKPKQRDGATRTLNPMSFGALAALYNSLYEAEGASDGPSLKRSNVLIQMGRLTKRQFEWQRKFATTSRLNRYHTIYRTESSKDYFVKKYGISFDVAMKSCFVIYAHLLNSPTIRCDLDATSIGLEKGDIAKTIDLISLPLQRVSEQARNLREGYDHIGYAPSVFRRFPLIKFENRGEMRAMCPLPDLVFFRMTEGLFYDFVDAPSCIRNEFAKNLELYIRDRVKSDCDFKVLGDVAYGKTSERTPDVLLSNKERIIAAIEVKGRRQSAPVRFSEDPTRELLSSFEELAKGVFQLWKYVADSGAGLIPSVHAAGEDAQLAICTLDNWIEFGRGIEEAIYRMAERKADSATRKIHKDARKRVSIFTINDLDFILSRSDVGTLLEVIRLSLTPEFEGWLLSSVFSHRFPEKVKARSVEPTQDVVPWWEALDPSRSASILKAPLGSIQE